jgi:hypothetical protein
MQITKRSILSGKRYTQEIDITEEQFAQVQNRRETGTPIQKIVPHLCADDREFLINGITREESEAYFGKEEEDAAIDLDENPR